MSQLYNYKIRVALHIYLQFSWQKCVCPLLCNLLMAFVWLSSIARGVLVEMEVQLLNLPMIISHHQEKEDLWGIQLNQPHFTLERTLCVSHTKQSLKFPLLGLEPQVLDIIVSAEMHFIKFTLCYSVSLREERKKMNNSK